MAEDGNCLFRAVADQVYGDAEMYDETRQMCIDYMARSHILSLQSCILSFITFRYVCIRYIILLLDFSRSQELASRCNVEAFQKKIFLLPKFDPSYFERHSFMFISETWRFVLTFASYSTRSAKRIYSAGSFPFSKSQTGSHHLSFGPRQAHPWYLVRCTTCGLISWFSREEGYRFGSLHVSRYTCAVSMQLP